MVKTVITPGLKMFWSTSLKGINQARNGGRITYIEEKEEVDAIEIFFILKINIIVSVVF